MGEKKRNTFKGKIAHDNIAGGWSRRAPATHGRAGRKRGKNGRQLKEKSTSTTRLWSKNLPKRETGGEGGVLGKCQIGRHRE